MLLEIIACPICGKSEYREIFKSKDFRLKTSDISFQLVKCNICDLIFLNPRPVRNELFKFYTSDFHKEDKSLLYQAIEPCFRIAQKSTLKILKGYRNNGKILDIGCGNGNFIRFMQKNGYDVWGVEPNLKAQKYESPCLKNRIFYKDLTECGFQSKTFDIITMFHSLEHVYNLNEILKEINRVLKDRGIFYICVPNASFFEFIFFGPYYYNLEVPRHLYFFTRKSLDNILIKNGFKTRLFLRDSIFELVLTPQSFYHGIWNFITANNIQTNKLIKLLTLVPLVVIRLALCALFIFQRQNLNVVSQINKNESI